MNGKVKAWYFSNSDEQLGHNDGRKIKVGITHEVNGKVIMCRHGLHASRILLDALRHAPGFILWEVECSGEIVESKNKLVASRRTYLRRLDCQKIIYNFTKACALSVLHLWEPPSVVCAFLGGDESLASDAAYAALNKTPDAAAGLAAYAAAGLAADAAMRAAHITAHAAHAAAYAAHSADAAYAAANIMQKSFLAEANDVLTEHVLEEMEKQSAADQAR